MADAPPDDIYKRYKKWTNYLVDWLQREGPKKRVDDTVDVADLVSWARSIASTRKIIVDRRFDAPFTTMPLQGHSVSSVTMCLVLEMKDQDNAKLYHLRH